MTSDKKTCETCERQGQVLTPQNKKRPGASYGCKICPDCNGTGTVSDKPDDCSECGLPIDKPSAACSIAGHPWADRFPPDHKPDAQQAETVTDEQLQSYKNLPFYLPALTETESRLSWMATALLASRAEVERLKDEAGAANSYSDVLEARVSSQDKQIAAADALTTNVTMLHANCAGCETCRLAAAFNKIRYFDASREVKADPECDGKSTNTDGTHDKKYQSPWGTLR